jgi:hypothetical protein
LMCIRSWHSTAATLCLYLWAELQASSLLAML